MKNLFVVLAFLVIPFSFLSAEAVLFTAANADEYIGAAAELEATIRKERTTGAEGYLTILNQCINGVKMFWAPNLKNGELYQYLKDNGKVVGLSRIKIEKNTDSLKIEDVVAHPDGKGYGAILINAAIDLAKKNGKKRVWLEAADAGVAQYYKTKFGFNFINKASTSGGMEKIL